MSGGNILELEHERFSRVVHVLRFDGRFTLKLDESVVFARARIVGRSGSGPVGHDL